MFVLGEVLCSVLDDYCCGKVLGFVELFQGYLWDFIKIFIGYSWGLLVIWNQVLQCVDYIFLGNQQLESLCWGCDSSIVVSLYSDGSYVVWFVDVGSFLMLQFMVVIIFYGFFFCKVINKILWWNCEFGGYFIIFSGGMFCVSYGDCYCVSVF